ncbi:holo-ACP synthase [Alicyclobacillus fodiniaquatilis]|uniref:Holo-[acyl-carrier-protein] synthase n=1 Tax=Alicyclobacillus fodiniaquatilis TaxID=1661150 RepID=A0ABW4JIT0_9BACL
MILGIGSDIAETTRIRQAIERHGQPFLRRVLGAAEQKQCAQYGPVRLAEFVAGRFAAKEALAKAVGCGLAKLSMASVSLMVTDDGLHVMWEARSALQRLGARDRLHVSISHTEQIAFATAIWERL